VIKFTSLIFCLFFVYACFSFNDNLDYDFQNQRFDYSSLIDFKSSIIIHFDNNTNRFDIKKLDNLEKSKLSKNDSILFKESKNHEQFVENHPDKIYKFILYLQDNDSSEKIIFESIQTYLRYLTKDIILR